jgi:hypothetical protein
MTNNDAIGGEHLDCSYSTGAEKALKTGQLALAFEHRAHNSALRRTVLVGSQHRR